MSHNTEPERAARRHPGPIAGIIIVLILVAIAAVWFTRSDPSEEGDVSRIETPEAPTADGPQAATEPLPPEDAPAAAE
ncbi:hypothetical protein [uncultured Paracoccus sp.]|uniref:hypothetical protein n=1 Tax=uncultured Paracoccus sp. TaxID=189685 RepID=UPI0025EEACD9|nr:hypothetical protein [uncultured Paracoccus sp.]